MIIICADCRCYIPSIVVDPDIIIAHCDTCYVNAIEKPRINIKAKCFEAKLEEFIRVTKAAELEITLEDVESLFNSYKTIWED